MGYVFYWQKFKEVWYALENWQNVNDTWVHFKDIYQLESKQ